MLTSLPRAAAVAVMLLVPLAAHAQLVQPMQSRPGPGEVDTASRRGGQAGGIGVGVSFTLPTLRCARGEAIVGMRIRRGDVLDWIQIACAQPNCADGTCQWAQRSWGPSAGNPQGGDPHPEMVCAQTEMVSAIRARVVAFTRFDYTADVAIECSTITGAADAQGFFPVGGQGQWHHPEDGFGRATVPGRVARSAITPPISCRPNGGVSALSLGVSDNFVRRGQRVVQAISLYCPAAMQQAAQCPAQLVVADTAEPRQAIDRWFGRGGLTGGGIVSTMQAQPANRNWTGTRLREDVRLVPESNVCHLPDAALLCGMGERRRPDGTLEQREFVIGAPGTANLITLPRSLLQVPWNVPAAQRQTVFADSHFVFDANNGQPIRRDLLWPVGGRSGCSVTCVQTYTCGAAPREVTYGPFHITYTFRRESLGPLGPIPVGAHAITRVEATKQ